MRFPGGLIPYCSSRTYEIFSLRAVNDHPFINAVFGHSAAEFPLGRALGQHLLLVDCASIWPKPIFSQEAQTCPNLKSTQGNFTHNRGKNCFLTNKVQTWNHFRGFIFCWKKVNELSNLIRGGFVDPVSDVAKTLRCRQTQEVILKIGCWQAPAVVQSILPSFLLSYKQQIIAIADKRTFWRAHFVLPTVSFS